MKETDIGKLSVTELFVTGETFFKIYFVVIRNLLV